MNFVLDKFSIYTDQDMNSVEVIFQKLVINIRSIALQTFLSAKPVLYSVLKLVCFRAWRINLLVSSIS